MRPYIEQAKKWYHLSAEQGDEDAKEQLKKLANEVGIEDKAIIHFYSEVEPAEWVKNSENVKWGLLFTTDDLVVVKENKAPNNDQPVMINYPRHIELESINKMATFKNINSGKNVQLSLQPGMYDWLVLMDIEGDGYLDGYLGTLASDGPLSSYEFEAGKSYFIHLGKRGTLSFRSE